MNDSSTFNLVMISAMYENGGNVVPTRLPHGDPGNQNLTDRPGRFPAHDRIRRGMVAVERALARRRGNLFG